MPYYGARRGGRRRVRRRGKKNHVSKGVRVYVRKSIMKDLVRKQICGVAGVFNLTQSATFQNTRYPTTISNNPGLNRYARTGNKIDILKYEAQFDLYLNGGTAIVPNIVRILTVYDKGCQCNSAIAMQTQCVSQNNNLFEPYAQSQSAAYSPMWYFNIDHVGPGSDHRFEVLADKIIVINPYQGGPPATGFSVTRHYHFKKSFPKGKRVVYDDDNNAGPIFDPTQVASGMIWHILWESQPAVGQTSCLMSANMEFVDAN